MHQIIERKGVQIATMDKYIKQLADTVAKNHSFAYKTLKEAMRTESVGPFFCKYDALSLMLYDHNMNQVQLDQFMTAQRGFFQQMKVHDHDGYKQINERRSLFWYLTRSDSPFR